MLPKYRNAILHLYCSVYIDLSKVYSTEFEYHVYMHTIHVGYVRSYTNEFTTNLVNEFVHY